jgi:hypothetical protein
MKTIRLLGLLGALLAPSLRSQPRIWLKTGAIDTGNVRGDPRVPAGARSLRGRRHWIVQFRSYPGAGLRAELARRGIRVLEYVPDLALMVSATGAPDLGDLDVRWAGALTPAEKISPLILGGQYDAFVVSFQLDADLEKARETVRREGFEVVENEGLLPRHLLITGPPDRLESLAADDEVAYVFPADWELRLRRPIYRCQGPITEAGVVADYALEGPGWPADATGNVALGYFFDSLTAKLDANTVRSEIERAFTEWERYANVSFTPAAQAAVARSVDILFASGAHGDDYPFTSTAVLAHTFFPAPPNAETIAGDMHFNNDVNWQVGSDVDVFSVALHEAGHALGLAHSDDPSAVMYPYYKLSTGLTSDDIAGIQALYGSPGTSPTSPTPPTSPTSPTSPTTPTSPTSPTSPSTPTSGSTDTTPPSLTIVSPPATTVSAYSSPMLISGTASDNVAVAYVEWSNSTGGSGRATGTTSWSVSVPLLIGDNMITLTAHDAAGNSAWRAIMVVRQ